MANCPSWDRRPKDMQNVSAYTSVATLDMTTAILCYQDVKNDNYMTCNLFNIDTVTSAMAVMGSDLIVHSDVADKINVQKLDTATAIACYTRRQTSRAALPSVAFSSSGMASSSSKAATCPSAAAASLTTVRSPPSAPPHPISCYTQSRGWLDERAHERMHSTDTCFSSRLLAAGVNLALTALDPAKAISCFTDADTQGGRCVLLTCCDTDNDLMLHGEVIVINDVRSHPWGFSNLSAPNPRPLRPWC